MTEVRYAPSDKLSTSLYRFCLVLHTSVNGDVFAAAGHDQTVPIRSKNDDIPSQKNTIPVRTLQSAKPGFRFSNGLQFL